MAKRKRQTKSAKAVEQVLAAISALSESQIHQLAKRLMRRYRPLPLVRIDLESGVIMRGDGSPGPLRKKEAVTGDPVAYLLFNLEYELKEHPRTEVRKGLEVLIRKLDELGKINLYLFQKHHAMIRKPDPDCVQEVSDLEAKGKTHEEIADELCISVSAVRQRKYRAKRRARETGQ
jgi:hypothetical protein